MKDWIRDRLNKIEDLKQRRVLRDIVVGAFTNMVEYSDDMYARLEERIRLELADFRLEFDIYTGITKREDYDPINDFLYAMDPEDAEEKIYDLNDIMQRTAMGEEVVLGTIFLQCETSKVRALLAQNADFHGKIRTDANEYDAVLALRPCRRYKSMIAELYEVFMFNDVTWKTINTPYLEKFVDVVLIGQPELNTKEKMREISVNLREYEPYKLTDRIPVWNISRMDVKNTVFPMPALDTINYEHTIMTRELGIIDNFLVDSVNENVKYIKRNLGELVIVSPFEAVRDWRLVRISSPREEKLPWIKQPLGSNARDKFFVDKYAATLSLRIRSKGEIARLLASLEASKDWTFEDVKLLDNSRGLTSANTYDFNFFLADHVRTEEDKKTLALYFRAQRAHDYTTDDSLSFLVSEVALSFPDYHCLGVIL